MLNAFVYVAAGVVPPPIVVLLHGFPGNERDLAQTLRRAGYDVLYLDYRGSWGSPGKFSFSNSIEDVLSAIAYLRDPANAAKLHADPKRIVLIGHSMGGFLALNAAALDPAVSAVINISAADLSTGLAASVPAGNRDAAIKGIAAGLASQGMAPLAGCTPEGLAREVFANAAKWNFVAIASKLATRPVLVIPPTTDWPVRAINSSPRCGNSATRRYEPCISQPTTLTQITAWPYRTRSSRVSTRSIYIDDLASTRLPPSPSPCSLR